MKKLYELTKFECYIHIFKPLFKYSMDNYLWDYGWDIEKMIEGEWTPQRFIMGHYPDIEEEFKKRRLERNDPREYFPPHDDKVDLLYKKGIADEYSYPVIGTSLNKDHILIEIKHVFNYRNRGDNNEFKDDQGKYFMKFFTNGNIEKSYQTSREGGGMITYVSNKSCFLSYRETLKMREYFSNLGIDCVNIHETDFAI